MTRIQSVQYGKYTLLDKIAVGGMAELFRAKIRGEQGFEKLVVIKRILPHLSTEANLVASFIDEAKLAAFLQHQNITQIYDFGSIDGSYFIAMEYLFGNNLRSVFETAKTKMLPLSLENTLYITSRICDGLDYAHKLRDFKGYPLHIIHRDISPPNIVITYDGHVKIVDFGIAKASGQNTKTQIGIIKGKVAYMSPEQAEGDPIDHRSDIFATGILLYEMVTQKRMYAGDTMQILSKARKAEYVDPENLVDNLPTKLCEIINKALKKNPDHRYQTSGDLMNDIEECLFDLSYRPMAKGLAKYMSILFAKEKVAEEQLMQEAARAGHAGTDEDASSAKGVKNGHEETVLLKPDSSQTLQLTSSKRFKTFLFAGIGGIILVVLGMLYRRPDLPPENQSTKLVKSIPPKPTSPKTSPTTAEVIRRPFPAMDPPVEDPPLDLATTQTGLLPEKPVAKEPQASPPPLSSPDQTDSLNPEFQKGLDALKAKKYKAALSHFDQASLPLTSEEISAYLNALFGRLVEIEDHDAKSAKPILEKITSLKPDHIQAHYQLGQIYLKASEYPAAINQYQQAIKNDPGFTNAYFNLGYIYALAGDYTLSEKMYQKVVELNPPFIDEALFNLAVIQHKAGKQEKAIENLEKAIAINPDNKNATRYLATLKGH